MNHRFISAVPRESRCTFFYGIIYFIWLGKSTYSETGNGYRIRRQNPESCPLTRVYTIGWLKVGEYLPFPYAVEYSHGTLYRQDNKRQGFLTVAAAALPLHSGYVNL